MDDMDERGPAKPEWARLHPSWSRREIERRSCLDMMMERFGIDSALVSVPQLAKAFGISKSTIYARLEAGDFFVPHRFVGRSPVFTVDDVVTWYLTGAASERADPAPPPRREPEGERPSAAAEASAAAAEDESFARRKRDEAVDSLVAKALAKMKARGRR